MSVEIEPLNVPPSGWTRFADFTDGIRRRIMSQFGLPAHLAGGRMSQRQAEESGLLEDVIQHPDDDAPRLIFADWCEDNGQLERAAVIRGGWRYLQPAEFWLWFSTPSVRCRFPGSAHCHVREGEREGERQTTIVGHDIAVPEDRWEFGFRKGFPERIRLPLADWMKYGKALVKEFPLRRVELSDKAPAETWPGRWTWGRIWASRDEGQLDRLPPSLFNHMFDPVIPPDAPFYPERVDHYDTPEKATLVLSTACLLFASS